MARLGETGVGSLLPVDEWLPAPAQGAIGIECRSEDASTRALLAAIDDPESRAAVMAERALLAALGGGCHSPVAVLTTLVDGSIDLRAALFSDDGAARIERSLSFDRNDAGGPGRLARTLLDGAPAAIARLFAGLPHSADPC